MSRAAIGRAIIWHIITPTIMSCSCACACAEDLAHDVFDDHEMMACVVGANMGVYLYAHDIEFYSR